MIKFPFKRVYGFLGATRSGKNSVADFLTETRGFEQLAFADQIKEDFGISKEDFEAAKIAGNIEELRSELWAFSAKKKKEDINYFINKVIDKIKSSEKSIIITDIRTIEELTAFSNIELDYKTKFSRTYWICGPEESEFDDEGRLAGSKLSESDIVNEIWLGRDVHKIYNRQKIGLYGFYQQLDKLFFCEDIKDMQEGGISAEDIQEFLTQFDVKLKGSL